MEHVHDPESTDLSGMAVVATAIGLGAFGTLAVGRWRSGATHLAAAEFLHDPVVLGIFRQVTCSWAVRDGLVHHGATVMVCVTLRQVNES